MICRSSAQRTWFQLLLRGARLESCRLALRKRVSDGGATCKHCSEGTVMNVSVRHLNLYFLWPFVWLLVRADSFIRVYFVFFSLGSVPCNKSAKYVCVLSNLTQRQQQLSVTILFCFVFCGFSLRGDFEVQEKFDILSSDFFWKFSAVLNKRSKTKNWQREAPFFAVTIHRPNPLW